MVVERARGVKSMRSGYWLKYISLACDVTATMLVDQENIIKMILQFSCFQRLSKNVLLASSVV